MEDSGIIDLFLNRSERAIAETSRKYKAYCMTIAMNILASRSDAEEIVNDVFLAVWNAIPPEKPRKLSAFIGRITRNIAFDKYDYYNAKKRSSEFDLLLSELSDCISSNEDVEEQYEAGRIAELINAFLRELKDDSRNVFIRRYWYADSVSDLSKRFAISESKVKSLLFRTRNKLKLYLEKEGITL